VINVDLDDPRFDPVFQYAADVAPERPIQDSLRDLLLQAVALDAKDASIRDARRQAFREARDYSLRALGTALRQIADHVDGAITSGGPVNPADANTIASDAISAKVA
jgi:hypothetical protein